MNQDYAYGNWGNVMFLSNTLLILGIWLISDGWEKIYRAEGGLVTEGVYRYVRHPQDTDIFVITIAFMIQWPTITTVLLWPFIIVMYVRLAHQEEQDVMRKYPQEY